MDSEESLLSRSSLVKGHVDTLITVSTAVLVLSLTIIKEFNLANLNYKELLQASWIFLMASIVFGLAHNYILVHLLKNIKTCWDSEHEELKNTCNHSTFLVIFLTFLQIFFVVALVLFLIFALYNL